jgi:hypothetical protein
MPVVAQVVRKGEYKPSILPSFQQSDLTTPASLPTSNCFYSFFSIVFLNIPVGLVSIFLTHLGVAPTRSPIHNNYYLLLTEHEQYTSPSTQTVYTSLST